MTTKDLNYYVEHPDEMPDDPALIDQIVNSTLVEGEADPDGKTAEDKGKEPETLKEPEKEATDTQGEKPAGVLAKDGKNLIPFSVLEKTRERAAQLEEAIRAQAEEIERLKAGKASTEDVELFSDEELEAMESDDPVIAKMAKAVLASKKTIEALNAKLQEKEQAAVEEESTKRRNAVQEAIDANPDLAVWQQADEGTPEMERWEYAVKQDAILKDLPKWQGKPLSERYQEVVRLVKEGFGDQVQSTDRNGGGKKEDPPTRKPAANRDEGPTSLSELPGGRAPEGNELNIDAIPTFDLAEKVMSMSDAKLQALLQRVA